MKHCSKFLSFLGNKSARVVIRTYKCKHCYIYKQRFLSLDNGALPNYSLEIPTACTNLVRSHSQVLYNHVRVCSPGIVSDNVSGGATYFNISNIKKYL